MMNRLQVRHILYPMDWSPMSMNALHWANAMARAQEAELRAFPRCGRLACDDP
jgi:hypothetical protein